MECTSVWDCQTCSLLAVEECYSLQTQSLSKALTPLPLIPPAYMIKPFIRSAKSLFGPGRSACLNTEWVLMMVKRTPNKRAPPAASLRNGEVSFPRANLANQIMRSSHGRANSSLTFDNGNWRKRITRRWSFWASFLILMSGWLCTVHVYIIKHYI